MTWKETRICRFCEKDVEVDFAIHYNVRHYAHVRCFIASKGVEAIAEVLSPWQIQNFNLEMMVEGRLNLTEIQRLKKKAQARQRKSAKEWRENVARNEARQ